MNNGLTDQAFNNIDHLLPGSPHCRAVLMCIKALDLDVDLIKLDMYQKYEHKKPWFVKVNYHFFVSKVKTHCPIRAR